MLAYCVLIIEKACTDPSLVRRLSAYTSHKWCSRVVRQGCVGVVPPMLPRFYERTILHREHCPSSAAPCQLLNVRVALWRWSSLAVPLAKTVHRYCGLGFGICIDLEMGLDTQVTANIYHKDTVDFFLQYTLWSLRGRQQSSVVY